MYRVLLKSLVVDSLRQVFDSNFLSPDFQNTYVSIEYPMDKQNFPSVWVNYDDSDSVKIAGIAHTEVVYDHPLASDPTQPDPAYPDNPMHLVTRWLFAGEVTLTFVALSSLERDDLYDQFVRVFAFSRMEAATVDFRDLIENNEFVALNVNWDELRPHGDAASPGTPWGTENEVIYEVSLGFDVEGEFVSDPTTNTLVPLNSVVVTGTELDMVSGDQLDSSQYIL